MSEFKYSTKWGAAVLLYSISGKIPYGFTACDRPYEIPVAAVRNGTYEVRSYGYRKTYHHLDGLWLESDFLHKSSYQIVEWNLLPHLTEREWDKLNAAYEIEPRCFTPKWEEYLMAQRSLRHKRVNKLEALKIKKGTYGKRK